jgi:hypothetical protein
MLVLRVTDGMRPSKRARAAETHYAGDPRGETSTILGGLSGQVKFVQMPPVMRGVKVRSHHRQHPSIAGSWAGLGTLVTDPLLRAAVTTLWFAGTHADLMPAVINGSGPFSTISNVFGI